MYCLKVLNVQTLKTDIQERRESARKKASHKDFSAFANIAEQNASEAAFLWILRSQAVSSAQYYPVDIRELEGRIEANLEGLSAIGELGWQVCADQLVYEEPGEIFTAAVIALRSRNAVRIKMVCELALKTPEMTKGIISALGWVEAEIATFWMQRFLSVTDPKYRMLGLAACSVRREDPGKYFLQILQDPDLVKYPAMHARALRLIGELNRSDLIPALNAAMDADDPLVKFWANWSSALLGNRASVINLKPFLLENDELSFKAIQLIFSLLPVNEGRKWIGELATKPELKRLVITGIGILGDPHAIPWLIQQMKNDQLARIAAWAFSQITGIDLESSNLVIEQADDFETGPTDDIDDENTEMDADEELPWPNVQKISQLWQVHHQLLQPGQRYFQGQEVTKQVLANIFVNANQQQKDLAALQRAALDKHTVLVNTHAREL